MRTTGFGTISIPRMNLRQRIYVGVSQSVLRKGIGYWPGTALPGQPGNMVLGGHRTAAPRPFYDIQKLAVGDRIVISHGGRRYTYVVNGTKVVGPRDTWILARTEASTLTMFACHPRGSTRQRFVVTATFEN